MHGWIEIIQNLKDSYLQDLWKKLKRMIEKNGKIYKKNSHVYKKNFKIIPKSTLKNIRSWFVLPLILWKIMAIRFLLSVDLKKKKTT